MLSGIFISITCPKYIFVSSNENFIEPGSALNKLFFMDEVITSELKSISISSTFELNEDLNISKLLLFLLLL